MKRFLLITALAVLVAGLDVAVAQTKVKFICNTAAVSDTIIASSSKMAVTGDKAALGPWNDGVALSNIGGDYWSGEVTFTKGDTVEFKFRLNGGWENGGNHKLIVGAADTTLPVMFYNAGSSKDDQYWRPYTVANDSMFTVWVRVNMQAVMENKTFGWTDADKNNVGVRGDGKGGPDLDWGTTFYLTQEGNPYFFSGALRFRKSQVKAYSDTVNYKFIIGDAWGRDERQGGKPNRNFAIPIGKADTTLAYVYFDDTKPVTRINADTCIITFNVDLATAISTRGFAQGDTVQVQSGFFNTGLENGRTRQLNLLIGTRYTLTDTVVTSIGKVIDYQYYLVKNANQIRENYYNFDYVGVAASERERRQFTVPSKTFTVTDNLTDVSAARRQPVFPSQKALSQAVTVKWTVDLRPAYAQVKSGSVLLDGQGDANVSIVDSIKTWGVGINGPATNLPTVYPVGDWATWDRNMVADTNKRKMWDDGTHGDAVANDSIYTVTYTYPAGATAGKVYKFGIRGGDNEAGGAGFGLNHSENISDVSATYTIATDFGSINPKFYTKWNFGTHTVNGVTSNFDAMPKAFALNQNYPNPFNPSTKISFALPVQSVVKLTIYNIVGQEVGTLVNQTMNAGMHEVEFNASALSSGVYFFRLSAGQFTSMKKMMLLK